MVAFYMLLLAFYFMPGRQQYVDVKSRMFVLWLHQYWEWDWIYDRECTSDDSPMTHR